MSTGPLRRTVERLLREIEAARRKPAGLTETVYECLRSSPYHDLSANEVREFLEQGGFDLSDYSQPLATVSVTLRRLAESGKVKAIRKGRNVTYQWIAN
jgi:predicted transcriptional regulator